MHGGGKHKFSRMVHVGTGASHKAHFTVWGLTQGTFMVRGITHGTSYGTRHQHRTGAQGTAHQKASDRVRCKVRGTFYRVHHITVVGTIHPQSSKVLVAVSILGLNCPPNLMLFSKISSSTMLRKRGAAAQ